MVPQKMLRSNRDSAAGAVIWLCIYLFKNDIILIAHSFRQEKEAQSEAKTGNCDPFFNIFTAQSPIGANTAEHRQRIISQLERGAHLFSCKSFAPLCSSIQIMVVFIGDCDTPALRQVFAFCEGGWDWYTISVVDDRPSRIDIISVGALGIVSMLWLRTVGLNFSDI
jgi:hypothetical protein